MMKKIIFQLFVCALSMAVYAQNLERDLEKAIVLHNVASENGSVEQILQCQKLLLPYIEKDAVCRAYYGSALTIEAAFTEKTNPIKALSLLETGSTFIDTAVLMERDNPVLRIIRLTNGVEVSSSSPFKRYSVLKDDIAWFKKHGINYDTDTNAQLYYTIALYHIAANDIDSALDALDNCIDTKSADPVVKKAEALLRRYEE
jgi:hypothetical protein